MIQAALAKLACGSNIPRFIILNHFRSGCVTREEEQNQEYYGFMTKKRFQIFLTPVRFALSKTQRKTHRRPLNLDFGLDFHSAVSA